MLPASRKKNILEKNLADNFESSALFLTGNLLLLKEEWQEEGVLLQ
jgi:hypothetical protein